MLLNYQNKVVEGFLALSRLLDQQILYYDFTAKDTYTLETGTTKPTQDEDHIYFILGYVTWNIDHISAVAQHGNIHYPARFV